MPDFFPVWGERSADIAPQVYNWAQTNYRNQEANIGRLGDYDRQAIANQQNYFQARQAMEREDANRQLAAQELSRREAADQGRLAQGAYQFQATLKDSAARLAEDKRLHNLQYGPGAEAAAAADALAKRRDALTSAIVSGKVSPLLSPSYVATTFKLSPDEAAALMAPHVEPFKTAKVDALNIELDKLRAKLKAGQQIDFETANRLRDNLPPQLRDQVFLDQNAMRFGYAKPAAAGMGNMRASQAYDFAPTTGTGTAQASGASAIIPPYGNQGGGYFPQTPAPAMAAAAPTIAPPPSPAAVEAPGQFLIMKNTDGRPVRVPWNQIKKAQALGYYQ